MRAENPAAVKAADLNKVRLSSGESERRSAMMKAVTRPRRHTARRSSQGLTSPCCHLR